MNVPIDQELVNIAKEIVAAGLSLGEWVERESDDEFQSSQYCGGFDADEQEFCFSYYCERGEIWFQLSLDEVFSIAEGKEVDIQGWDAYR